MHTEMVSVWAEAGHFSMPYALFLGLFGITLDRFDQRKLVTLPCASTTVKT